MHSFAGALVLVGLLLAGCGGSSSESPFPLEPDPRKLKSAAPRNSPYVVLDGQSRPAHPQAQPESGDGPSTWGATKPTPPPADEPSSNEDPQPGAPSEE